MIGFLRGRVVAASVDCVTLDVHGVGYEVVPSSAALRLCAPGADVHLVTRMVVREDSQTLFGFADAAERSAFELLQSVSGVGPKVALAVLGGLGSDGLASAVAGEDANALAKAPGVGKRLAARIIVDLRGKLAATGAAGTPVPPPAAGSGAATADGWRGTVQQALEGLGWGSAEANAAVTALDETELPLDSGGRPDVSAALRTALRSLSRPVEAAGGGRR